MKRSAYIQLVLLGSAVGLTACDSPPQTLQQQRYASREDCLKDWGTPADCTPTAQPGAGGSGFYYFGPRYYWDSDAGRPMAVDGDGTVRSVPAARIAATGSALGETHAAGSFSRGGFGGMGHGFGAGE